MERWHDILSKAWWVWSIALSVALSVGISWLFGAPHEAEHSRVTRLPQLADAINQLEAAERRARETVVATHAAIARAGEVKSGIEALTGPQM